MSATPDTISHPAPALPRDEITHRVLALCAETDAITRKPLAAPDVANGPGWRPYLRNVYQRRVPRDILCYSLTALEKAGLIAWYDDRNAAAIGTQYAEETPAGKATLLRWDAELFGDASS